MQTKFAASFGEKNTKVTKFLSLRDTLHAAVRVYCVTAFRMRKNGIVGWPWPSAKARSAVIVECLLYLCPRVHHERSILYDRFSDRPALKQKQFAFNGPIVERDLEVRLKLSFRVSRERLLSDPE